MKNDDRFLLVNGTIVCAHSQMTILGLSKKSGRIKALSTKWFNMSRDSFHIVLNETLDEEEAGIQCKALRAQRQFRKICQKDEFFK